MFSRVLMMAEGVKNNLRDNPWWIIVITNLMTILIVSLASNLFSSLQNERKAIHDNVVSLARIREDMARHYEQHSTLNKDHHTFQRLSYRFDTMEERSKENEARVIAIGERLQFLERRLWHLLREPQATHP